MGAAVGEVGADQRPGYARCPVSRLASVYPIVSARTLARPFTYEIEDEVEKGAVLAIPFGNARRRGVVVDVDAEAPADVVPVAAERVLENLPPALVDLALWLADYYGSTPARALALIAPQQPKRRGERRKVTATAGLAAEPPPARLSETQERALERIESLLASGGGNVLLAGATGSGKTEVYIRACEAAARGRPRRDRARARDRAHAADARPLPRALRRPRRAAPLRPLRGRAARRARADPRRRGVGRRRRALGRVRAAPVARRDLRRRGARRLVQAGVGSALRRPHRRRQAGRARGSGRDLRLGDAAAGVVAGARAARARRAGSPRRCRRCASSTCARRRPIRCRRRSSPSSAGSRRTAARRSCCSTAAASRPRSIAAPAASPAAA